MGSEIRVESQLNQGSSFFFTLPLKAVKPSQINAQHVLDNTNKSEAQSLNMKIHQLKTLYHPIRVLLAEDNALNQEIAMENLKKVNAQVILANNGQEAVEKLLENEVDIILMDLQMPLMSGYEAARKIRDSGLHQNLPIIALSAHAVKGVFEQCLQAGMNDYLSKPFHMDTLVEMLIKWLKPRRSLSDVEFEELDKTPVESSPSRTNNEDITINNLYGINYLEGMANCGDDNGLFRSILEEFKNTHKNDPQHIFTLIKKQEWEECLFQIHRLKGVAASVGAKKLAELLKALEFAVKNQEINQLQSLSEKLQEEAKLIWQDLEFL